MILISNLTKEYPGGTFALKGITLHIKRGEFVVLLGSSGAGKSTILRCINGLIKTSGGEITVNDIPVNYVGANLLGVRKHIGMIFQQFNLVKRLSVLENVLCGRLAYTNVFSSSLKLFHKEDIEFAKACLERVGLGDMAKRRADQLSGGQQQRVGIARALVQRPRVILADEPVASLDPKTADYVLEILRIICLEDNITVMVSLHNIELARHYGERIIGIRDGSLVIDKKASLLSEADVESIYGHNFIENMPVLQSCQIGFVNA